MKKVTDHLQGKPSVVRWVATVVLVWPVILARVVIIVALAGLWAINAPRVAMLTWNSIVRMESPNQERTPKMSRPLQRLDDFDGVRARIRGLMQRPKR